jgi:DNA-binding transcriptional LysR family regulator
MDLNQMLVFVRVVQAGSFSAAARQLGAPKSTLSRKVSELEERLGSRLLQRTTRKLGLTDAGRIYFDHAARIVAEAQIAEQAVGHLQASPRGLLRVTTPLSFVVLPPLVSAFAKKYPDVQLDIVCSDRRVDLVDENFDVAIRTGALADSSLVARPLGTFKRVVVAAPEYCKEHGTPTRPADLERHACITFGAGISPNTWVLGSGEQRVEIHVTPRLTANDLDILRSAALDGLGIAFIPEFACAEDVRKNRLRHVLPEWCSAETPVHAVYPTARHLSPKVGAFIDLVRERIELTI